MTSPNRNRINHLLVLPLKQMHYSNSVHVYCSLTGIESIAQDMKRNIDHSCVYQDMKRNIDHSCVLQDMKRNIEHSCVLQDMKRNIDH